MHGAVVFFNFFLALEKICAYIRNCRCVPRPQEKNSSAETDAAGNFRLERAFSAKRGKPCRRKKESKQGWTSSGLEDDLTETT
ncbi:MAG: hypothetical protein DMG39_09315 [Acidobacteria bacterium]|nr:MAG: hypothetical protein DMG39_09315 [Acidobacteriota bacterium]